MAPAPLTVRPAVPQLDKRKDEVIPVPSSVITSVVDGDPGETDVWLDRSEFESQILDIVVGLCERLHLTPPSSVEEVVDRLRSWSEERLSEVAIASLLRQLASARTEVGSLTEAVVAPGECERVACDAALAEGQHIIGLLFIYSLNANREGELEFREGLGFMRADLLIVSNMA